jgi:hypothetical protein
LFDIISSTGRGLLWFVALLPDSATLSVTCLIGLIVSSGKHG